MNDGPVFLFGGQACDEPGMGLALSEAHPPAAALLAVASEATGVDLRRGLRRGNLDPVAAQAAVVAVQLGAVSALAEAGLRPAAVAGHSLGELSAWAATGAVAAAEVVRAAAQRARWLAAAAEGHDGGLVLVEDPPTDLPEEVVVAAHNAPDLWVLAGPIARMADRGPVLPRLGPWHHPWMAPVVAPLREALAALPARVVGPVWLTADGPVPAGEAAARLAEQVARPVRFVALAERLRGRRLIVCGPGRVLRGLLRRNGLACEVADTPDAVRAAASA